MSLRKSAISGLFWTYGQMFGTQAISFAVSIILARLLLPEEFGLIGMLAIFVGIGTALFNGGLTTSLVRTPELDSDDYSTVFYFNIAGSIVVFAVLYLCAPLIADFYQQPVLKSLSRVYGLSFILAAFGAVQNAILIRAMKFRSMFILTLPALLISSAVSVFMALNGYGVWSLVIAYLVNGFCTSLFLWFASDWRPRLVFSKAKFNQHFGFGYKMSVSSLLDTIFSNIYQVVIGRFYSAALVGYYTRATTLMMLPVSNVSNALNTVVFPLFSKVQDDIPRFRNAYKQIMLMVLFIIVPILVLMLSLAEPLVVFLFTDKWLPIVPIFRILCVGGILYPIHSYNLMVLQVVGRSDLFLRLEIIKKILNLIILVISFFFGFYSLLWGYVLFSFLALFINTHYAGKILRYNVFVQLKDMLPILLMGVVALLVSWGTLLLLGSQPLLLQLGVSGLAGATAYVLTAWLLRFQSLQDIKTILLKK